MRVLFDQATPLPIRAYLDQHVVSTASQQGWDTLSNGDLLAAAEKGGFDVLLTTDKNLRHQQNLAGRKIAVVILGRQQWPQLRTHVQRVLMRSMPPCPAPMLRSTFRRSESSNSLAAIRDPARRNTCSQPASQLSAFTIRYNAARVIECTLAGRVYR